ncbi:MAG TPA: TonB-dependent receptor, partial [Clostridia bacterium]|nr:TonB-dependent receptor [Clostridia bacterium]
MKQFRLVSFAFVMLLSMTVIGLAQSDTARLIGTVTDPSGAAVPGATITVVNQGTGRTINVQTGENGNFAIAALPSGRYHVEAKQPNFKTSTADLTLEVSQVQELNFRLETGSVETVVNVTDEVPLVETATSSTGDVIQGRQVTELPLNGRNFTQLALLTPGVTRGAYGDVSMGGTSGTNAEAFRNSETGGASLSANGLRPQANNFILDGVDNNEALVNSIVFFPPAEAIQEFRVNTSVAPAEFGRAGGAIVQTQIKSGTNAIHGSAFWFRRSGYFDAKPYATEGEVNFKRNQFGGTVGGPIWKNKVFFFGDYQGLRQSAPQNVEFATVPTERMRNGDFGELLGSGLTSVPACAGAAANVGAIYNPVTCTPFPGNIIPNPNPVGLAYLRTFPLPNVPGTLLQNFRAQRQSIRNFDDFDVRLDLVVTERDQVFARYSYGQDDFTVTNRLGPNNPSGFGSGNNFNHPRGVAFGYTRSFTANVVNEFRFGFTRPAFGYIQPNIAQTLAADIGIPNANRSPELGGQALIGGNNTQLEYQGDGGPYNVPQYTYQFSDAVSFNFGRHTVRTGFNIIRRQVNFFQGNNAKGYFIIGGTNFPGTGRFTGYEASELLAGFVDYRIGEASGEYETRNWETGYFIQDDWRVTDRLTLNLGLRYDLYTWPYEQNNRQSNFDPATGSLVVAGAPGWPRSLIETDKNNFAPRFGFAYDLFGSGRTVLRGGYGMFYFLDRGGVGNQLSNNPDFNGNSEFQACPAGDCTAGARITLSGQGPTGNNDWTLATQPLPGLQAIDRTNPENTTLIFYPRESQNSTVQQWNLQLEQAIGGNMSVDLAYVGTKMDHLATRFNANKVAVGTADLQWFPNLASIYEYGFIGSGDYHGLQTRLNRRFANGLQFTGAYTWSHTIDNSSNAFSTNSGNDPRIFVGPGGVPLLDLNRGNADNDIRHFF